MVTTMSSREAGNGQVSGKQNMINEDCGIKEVYASNLHEEFDNIRRIVDKFCFIAMDTEFPGVVARPIGEFKSTADYQYQLLRCNVDLLKLIQVGLTFLSDKGDMPQKYTTWQFNFRFSLGEDMYAQDSIDLLTNSGIKFKKHEEDGICFLEFAELLMTSGLILSDRVKWISFHSGYDFGYLLKLLTNCQLPADENEFFELLQIYFPAIYDVKYVMKSCRSLKGGLQEVADQLKIDRIGPQHQAGSDSLLTGLTFFRMKQLFFEDSLDDDLYCGHLFGLGAPYGNGAEPAAPPVPVVDLKNSVVPSTSNSTNNQAQNATDQSSNVVPNGVGQSSAAVLDSTSSAPSASSSSSIIAISSSSAATTITTTTNQNNTDGNVGGGDDVSGGGGDHKSSNENKPESGGLVESAALAVGGGVSSHSASSSSGSHHATASGQSSSSSSSSSSSQADSTAAAAVGTPDSHSEVSSNHGETPGGGANI